MADAIGFALRSNTRIGAIRETSGALVVVVALGLGTALAVDMAKIARWA